MAAAKLRLLIVLALCLVRAEENEHEHEHEHEEEHGDEPFEWAGLFEAHDRWLTLQLQKVEGVYAADHVKVVLLNAQTDAEEELHELEEHAEHAFEETCTEIEPNGVLLPTEDACYELHLNEEAFMTMFTIDAAAEHIALFMEHSPSEFESGIHYLKDEHGDDLFPIAEIGGADDGGHDDSDDTPWGAAIGAAFVVAAASLIGVIILGFGMLTPMLKCTSSTIKQFVEALLSSFAAGALICAAFMLLLLEAAHLLETRWDDETAVTWRWGTMILAGFLMPFCLEACITAIVLGTCRSQPPQQKSSTAEIGEGRANNTLPDKGSNLTEDMVKEMENQAAESKVAVVDDAGGDVVESAAAVRPSRTRVLVAILLGDTVHNYADGIFIGAAFKVCGHSSGWSIAASSVAHELAQELADYIILTSRDGGDLSPAMALLLNFLSGLFVVLGTITILASENISDADVGLILAFGGGTYLQVAASESMPKVAQQAGKGLRPFWCLLAFVIGATAIGLVLLDHEHCGSDDHGHGDHGH